MGCCFPAQFSSLGAHGVMLLIPGLLDREDELLALQCGTAPQGWGLGGVLAGGVLECSLLSAAVSGSGGESIPARRSPAHRFM